MLVNGFTDGSMTTSVTHRSLIVKHCYGPASPAGRHPAPPTPVTMSAALLHIYSYAFPGLLCS